jgi:hypothetical protein
MVPTFPPSPFPAKGVTTVQPPLRLWLPINFSLPPWGGPAEAA